MAANTPVAKCAHDTPFDASIVDGEVVVLGVRTSEALTPEAALESAKRLKSAAERALKERSESPGLGGDEDPPNPRDP